MVVGFKCARRKLASRRNYSPEIVMMSRRYRRGNSTFLAYTGQGRRHVGHRSSGLLARRSPHYHTKIKLTNAESVDADDAGPGPGVAVATRDNSRRRTHEGPSFECRGNFEPGIIGVVFSEFFDIDAWIENYRNIGECHMQHVASDDLPAAQINNGDWSYL